MRLVGHPWTCLQAGDGGGELGGGRARFLEGGTGARIVPARSAVHEVAGGPSALDV